MHTSQFDQRKSGLALIGDLPWGSHFCQFYRTPQDLRDILVPYFQAGLENNELCLWVTAEPLAPETARAALKKAVPDIMSRLRDGQMEIVPASRWLVQEGKAGDPLAAAIDRAIAGSFDGLRLACNAIPAGRSFTCPGLQSISGYHAVAAYLYPHDSFDALRLMEVVRNHRFALVRNAGKWEVIESSEAQIVKATLKRSEEKLRSLFSNMSEGFAYHRIVLDEAGQPCDFVFLEVNEAFAKLTGLKTEAILGKRATQVLPGIERDPADWIGRYGQVALTGKPVHFESFSQQLKRWYAVSAFSPHKGCFAVTFSDITERKRADEALRESEQRVRLKLESILSPEGDMSILDLGDVIDAPAIQSLMDYFYQLTGIPMAIIDREGRVLVGVGWQQICLKFHRVHPETCRFCIESDTLLTNGVAPGEFKIYKCKNNMWDVATPILVGGNHVGNLFTGQFFFEDETPDRELFRAQARRYGFDEEEYLAALDQVPHLSRKAVDTGMVFLIKLAEMISQLSTSNLKLARALTERQRVEQALRSTAEDLARSNQDLEQFAYVASHDLQEPLRMVTGFVELLREESQGKLGGEAETYITYAVDGARRMQILIDDLLAYSRVSSRGGSFEFTDSREALDMALAGLQSAIAETGATIERGELPSIRADGRQLTQLFQNLVGNALKFHGEAPPRVRVEARRDGDHWEFCVADNGIGIAPEYRDRIFLIFQRLHTRQKYPGTGIGLAICKKIVERHGGHIRVESEPEQGSRFLFTIPA